MKAKTKRKMVLERREQARLAGQLNSASLNQKKSKEDIEIDKVRLGIKKTNGGRSGKRCEICADHQLNGWCNGHSEAIKTKKDEVCNKFKAWPYSKEVGGGLFNPR